MTEMDPSKHILMNSNNIEKENSGSIRYQRIIFIMLLAIIYMFGIIYYRDFYRQENTNLTSYYEVVDEANSGQDQDQDFSKAKLLIDKGVAKWPDLKYVEYVAEGRGLDEVIFFYDEYSYDFVKDEFELDSNVWCNKNYIIECFEEARYIKIDGKLTRYVENDKTVLDSYDKIMSLDVIKEHLYEYLTKDSKTYEVRTQITDGIYDQYYNFPVTYLDINYYRKNEIGNQENLNKGRNNVVLDEYNIKVTVDKYGNIMKLEFPYADSQIKVRFVGIDRFLEITSPD